MLTLRGGLGAAFHLFCRRSVITTTRLYASDSGAGGDVSIEGGEVGVGGEVGSDASDIGVGGDIGIGGDLSIADDIGLPVAEIEGDASAEEPAAAEPSVEHIDGEKTAVAEDLLDTVQGGEDAGTEDVVKRLETVHIMGNNKESGLVNKTENIVGRETIGFIGLGNIGAPMGWNLLKQGHRLVMYDISSKAMEPFKHEDSVVVASSPEDVALHATKIITVLPSSEDVEEVYRGNRGIFNNLQHDSLLIDSR